MSTETRTAHRNPRANDFPAISRSLSARSGARGHACAGPQGWCRSPSNRRASSIPRSMPSSPISFRPTPIRPNSAKNVDQHHPHGAGTDPPLPGAMVEPLSGSTGCGRWIRRWHGRPGSGRTAPHGRGSDPGPQGQAVSARAKILGIIPFGNQLKNYFDSYTSAQGDIASILQRLESGKKGTHLGNAAIDTERQKL